MTTYKTGFFLISSHSSSSATYKSNKKDYQAIKLSARERECEINCWVCGVCMCTAREAEENLNCPTIMH